MQIRAQTFNISRAVPCGKDTIKVYGRTDGRTDRQHDDANSRFSQFCEGN
jgi:hypothetical protein